ncbi:HemK family protein methyltransferase [Nonomuraea diastatica]|uniref:HemK family protein methyltransferase n=1 Tax=Nonomuraea diastatica TaxID=1848329 RepID=A0A4R4W8T7_9ACTN|nr:HemK family protein methyltransferase [Nonomuraea diastatica]TDD12184.1 HemK family protein methyltransferase [Nonomuraea diastatica]
MSVFSSPVQTAEIVTRLRAAGCVFAEDEAELLVSTASTPEALAAMVARRVAGVPLEHVLGWAEFCGLRVVVEPGVFVPRPRTEFLVRRAVALACAAGGSPVVLDLCCGTGAMGAALIAGLGGTGGDGAEGSGAGEGGARGGGVGRNGAGEGGIGGDGAQGGRAELHAADLDPVAVRCARRNLPGAHVYEGDLFEPLPSSLRGRVGLLIVSPPYVPSGSIGLLPSEARLHEPLMALDGGGDGLDVARRVIAEAPQWLAPGGHLLIETSERQAEATAAAVAGAGLRARAERSEELDATAVIGTRS